MKKFYKTVSTLEKDQGYTVLLDRRQVKTPLKTELIVPTQALADLIAAEWDAQGDTIDTQSMDVTKLANTALDRVDPRRDEVIAELVTYAGTDMICYYADYPEQLVSRQTAMWQPYHDLIASKAGQPFKTTSGIMHMAQDGAHLQKLQQIILPFDGFKLTAMHAFTTGLGSFSMGLALVERAGDVKSVWPAALVDELYQEEEWGEDLEAKQRRDQLLKDMQAAEQFLQAFV